MAESLPQELMDQFVVASHGDRATVESLLAEHPDLLRARARWDETPIQAATHAGSRALVEFFLERAAPLRRRTGIDEIGRRFSLQQIHLAVQHGAPCELARGGGAGPGGDQRRQRGGRHHQAAMRRNLHQVVARVGVRRREARSQALVDGLTRIGMQQSRAEHGARRRRHEGLETAGGEGVGAGARQANQCKGRTAGRRRECGDDVCEQSRS